MEKDVSSQEIPRGSVACQESLVEHVILVHHFGGLGVYAEAEPLNPGRKRRFQ
jgi:hypothetical protein